MYNNIPASHLYRIFILTHNIESTDVLQGVAVVDLKESADFQTLQKKYRGKHYDDFALKTFISGLPYQMQLVIRLRNPDSLEQALSFCNEEENFVYFSTGRNQNLQNPTYRSQPRINPHFPVSTPPNNQRIVTHSQVRYIQTPMVQNSQNISRPLSNALPANNAGFTNNNFSPRPYYPNQPSTSYFQNTQFPRFNQTNTFQQRPRFQQNSHPRPNFPNYRPTYPQTNASNNSVTTRSQRYPMPMDTSSINTKNSKITTQNLFVHQVENPEMYTNSNMTFPVTNSFDECNTAYETTLDTDLPTDDVYYQDPSYNVTNQDNLLSDPTYPDETNYNTADDQNFPRNGPDNMPT
nr:unnamed protein product [Callosobruchus chinensis]